MQVLKQEVREMILEAALAEFKVFGYSMTGMRDIAMRAGYTVGNIYRYYQDKDVLFTAVVDSADHHTRLALLAARSLEEKGRLIAHLNQLSDDELADIVGDVA